MNDIKVLVVDDDENTRYYCDINIQYLGYTVLLADDGQKGLEMAVESQPDLIILDILMPGLDGLQVLDQLKQNPKTSIIPVIMLSAETSVSQIEKALFNGADDYVKKPPELIELLARVKSLAKRGQLEKERVDYYKNAVVVQQRFLTNGEESAEFLKQARLNAVFFNEPALDISGDFWIHNKTPDGKVGLFVADICGHGYTPALMSMRILSIFDYCPVPSFHPSEFLVSINRCIHGVLSKEDSFVAGLYIIFEHNRIIFSNAGQPTLFLLRDRKVIELTISSGMLGISPNIEHSEMEHDFKKGDRLIIYTDGLYENKNSKEEVVLGRLTACLQTNYSLPIKELSDTLVAEMRQCTNGKFEDDVTLIIIEKE
ncbi:SpoIIE family protein phosphatase [Candidatus Magnetominusculus xianensis]|uniref:Stage II sporulation protein E n=1 Tax=Candidatus Magnetominusculus xianensis TaxID=1748249 RepID=A0ABR5SDT6_9BACT|nr:SpoIIE family protein phosphatase [Candidatus Magnetominusculus xianensis]KWT83479.1 stage II sporulation protein E [Candidatus Magnetominusculus xianensis]MBF0404119.1 SpoIIE family protein phosphatase [Nitrospirota bacterium]